MFQKIKEKMPVNQKGFTLIELMIVIAIIGILAAIAVPQFLSYRMRSYNTAAKAVANNTKADQGNHNAEHGIWACSMGGGAQLLSAGGGAAGGGGGTPFLDTVGGVTSAATPTNQGAVICGTAVDNDTPVNTYGGCVGVALGKRMNMLAQDWNNVNLNSSFVIQARHTKGDTVYAIDSDIENTLWFKTHADNYVNIVGVAPTDGAIAVVFNNNDIPVGAGQYAPVP